MLRPTAAEAVAALGELINVPSDSAGTRVAMSVLQQLVTAHDDPLNLKNSAIVALAATQSGGLWLLDLKERNQLPEALIATAGQWVRKSQFDDVRRKAQIVFPKPANLNMTSLPEIDALALKRGDAERGKAILAASANNDAACLKCHTVNGAGGQIGPDLSTIGIKASRENLLESLLYPSRAIADQFSQWQIVTKKGTTVIGLIVEETADAIVVRDANGNDTRVAKAEIESREKTRNSLMPDDNAATLTEEELIDLVEYLMTLKKAPPGGGGH
jgi:putative heme-binding domain-containing protein